MHELIQIGEKTIGPSRPVYVIAEAGVNHNGDPRLAHQLVDVAAKAGADAVKFQAFEPDQLCAADAPLADYAKSSDAADQRDLLRSLALSPPVFAELKDHARRVGVEFLCTPFDETSLELLRRLEVAAYKFASTDLTNDRLLDAAARTGKPLILSTGASTLEEIDAALAPLHSVDVLLLHCVSAYPTPIEQLHLATIAQLHRRYGRPVGFSDHTIGVAAAPFAVAAGARAIEKHFTLDPSMPGPDQKLSLGPVELGLMIEAIRRVERILGSPRTGVLEIEKNVRAVARKSLVAARDLPKGTLIQDADLTLKRPGTGLAPRQRNELVGRRLRIDAPKDSPLQLEMLE